MDIVGLYQQLNHKLEKVDFEKRSMMDEIRSKAVKQKAKLREAYMADEMESCFKGLALKALDVEREDVTEYTFVPEGLLLTSTHNRTIMLITWSEMRQGFVDEIKEAEYEEAGCEPRKELGCQE